MPKYRIEYPTKSNDTGWNFLCEAVADSEKEALDNAPNPLHFYGIRATLVEEPAAPPVTNYFDSNLAILSGLRERGRLLVNDMDNFSADLLRQRVPGDGHPDPPKLVGLVRRLIDVWHTGGGMASELIALRTYLDTMPREHPIPDESAAIEACRELLKWYDNRNIATRDLSVAVSLDRTALSGRAPEPDWRGMCEKLADADSLVAEQIYDAVFAAREREKKS